MSRWKVIVSSEKAKMKVVVKKKFMGGEEGIPYTDIQLLNLTHGKVMALVDMLDKAETTLQRELREIILKNLK